jgi:hypothetical protein
MFEKDIVMIIRNMVIATAVLAVFGSIALADMAPRKPVSKMARAGLVAGATNAELTPEGKVRKLRKSLRKCKREQCAYLDLRYLPITNLTTLSGMDHLETLLLSYTNVSDLVPIAGLTGMKQLHIGHTKVTDITPIAGMTDLELLHLWGTKITDFTPVSGFKKLHELALSETGVKNLQFLAPLQNLQRLNLGDLKIRDISVLEKLPKLQLVETYHLKYFNKRTVKLLDARGVYIGPELIAVC